MSTIKTLALYRPTNGTEGDCFIAKWCGSCRKESTCDVVPRAMIFDTSDKEYPREWLEEDGVPRCAAHEP